MVPMEQHNSPIKSRALSEIYSVSSLIYLTKEFYILRTVSYIIFEFVLDFSSSNIHKYSTKPSRLNEENSLPIRFSLMPRPFCLPQTLRQQPLLLQTCRPRFPSSSTSDVLQQQNSAQPMVFRNDAELIQALTKPLEGRKSLHLIRISLDDDLIWRLIESNPERLLLQNCDINTNGSSYFGHLFKFLTGANSSETCSRFAIQFKDCTTQCILYNEFPSPESDEHKPIASLLLILPSNVPQQSVLDAISSLVLLPSKPDLNKPLSSECNRDYKVCSGPAIPTTEAPLIKGHRFQW